MYKKSQPWRVALLPAAIGFGHQQKWVVKGAPMKTTAANKQISRRRIYINKCTCINVHSCKAVVMATVNELPPRSCRLIFTSTHKNRNRINWPPSSNQIIQDSTRIRTNRLNNKTFFFFVEYFLNKIKIGREWKKC